MMLKAAMMLMFQMMLLPADAVKTILLPHPRLPLHHHQLKHHCGVTPKEKTKLKLKGVTSCNILMLQRSTKLREKKKQRKTKETTVEGEQTE
jgi:hypothetical protein